jgi:hypothetical protein
LWPLGAGGVFLQTPRLLPILCRSPNGRHRRASRGVCAACRAHPALDLFFALGRACAARLRQEAVRGGSECVRGGAVALAQEARQAPVQASPTRAEVADVATRTRARLERIFKKHGRSLDPHTPSDADAHTLEQRVPMAASSLRSSPSGKMAPEPCSSRAKTSFCALSQPSHPRAFTWCGTSVYFPAIPRSARKWCLSLALIPPRTGRHRLRAISWSYSSQTPTRNEPAHPSAGLGC